MRPGRATWLRHAVLRSAPICSPKTWPTPSTKTLRSVSAFTGGAHHSGDTMIADHFPEEQTDEKLDVRHLRRTPARLDYGARSAGRFAAGRLPEPARAAAAPRVVALDARKRPQGGHPG